MTDDELEGGGGGQGSKSHTSGPSGQERFSLVSYIGIDAKDPRMNNIVKITCSRF